VTRSAHALEIGEELGAGRDQLVAAALERVPLLLLGVLGAGVVPAALSLLVERLERPPAGLLVDVSDDEEGEVEDALQVPGADVEEDAEARRRALEVPDVADRAGQLDVAHPLATHLGAGDLDAALVADDALVADPLVLPAVALPVLRGTEDALVEEAVLLRLERAVVDGLGLGDLAPGPLADLLGRGERDADGVEVVDLEHRSPPRRRGPSAARFGPGASGAGPAEHRLRVVGSLVASPRSRRG